MPLIRGLKQKKLKLFLLLVILIILGIVFAIFIGYRQTSEPHDAPGFSVEGDANMSIDRVHQTATKDGETIWRLDAASVKYIDAQKKALFRDISVTFFLKDGNNIFLTADKGVLKTDSNDIEVNGHVVVKNEGYQLMTEKLHYQNKKRFIFSKTPVTITGDYFELTADSMSVDLNANKAWFKGHVKGNFNEKAKL